jgi:hypothetical protein
MVPGRTRRDVAAAPNRVLGRRVRADAESVLIKGKWLLVDLQSRPFVLDRHNLAAIRLARPGPVPKCGDHGQNVAC